MDFVVIFYVTQNVLIFGMPILFIGTYCPIQTKVCETTPSLLSLKLALPSSILLLC